jgi:hypothetical protein
MRFFIGYAAMEVPSNWMLHKVGARMTSICATFLVASRRQCAPTKIGVVQQCLVLDTELAFEHGHCDVVNPYSRAAGGLAQPLLQLHRCNCIERELR